MRTVSQQATMAYRGSAEILVDHVNRDLAHQHNISALIGANPVEMMYSNHAHHHAFMAEVFELNQPQMLEKMVPWVYRAYSGQGFQFDYFLREFEAWIEAIKLHIPDVASEILPFYQWLQDNHERMIESSHSLQPHNIGVSSQYVQSFDDFLAALLCGDAKRALDIGDSYVENSAQLIALYLGLIQPSLYRIGDMWQSGKVSVAQEHLASGVVNRIMAYWYFHVLGAEKTKGKVIVTAGPNEFHSIGSHIVADLLAIDGWETIYLGANTPAMELVQLVQSYQPDLIAISVCMPFNLSKAREMVALARSANANKALKIMVGGQAFALGEDLWQAIGADGYAHNGDHSVSLAAQWYPNKMVI